VDVTHILAASAWLGALTVFALGLIEADAGEETQLAGLRGFSGFGIMLVGVLLVTGIANSLFLVGPSRLPVLWQNSYGKVLTAKILLFAGMLGLAARNRALITTPGIAIAQVRRNLLLETGLGVTVLALVAWLGMLQPV
jgi:putative copper resistance protein D